MQKNAFFLSFAAANGLLGAAMGAVAAHSLSEAHAVQVVSQAALYQLIHAVVLYMIALRQGRVAMVAYGFFAAGIILFCGGIYAKYCLHILLPGPVIPWGGGMLMLGWAALAMSAI